MIKNPSRLMQNLDSLPDRYISALLLFVILGLFVTFNKAVFQSYFSDDDFSNLMTARFVPWMAFPKTIFSLGFTNNVRPSGLLYYKILGVAAHYKFGAYVAVLQTLHVATALMLWFFLRRLGLGPFPAALGCFFFTMHMSALPAYWKPMYVFDVLCGFWVVMALLSYQRERFFLSFVCAWLAFRSKEMELMLPLLLLLYEWQFGQRRWRPLIPFFLMSLLFGMQALMHQQGPETRYTMHLTLPGLWSLVSYYGGQLFYAPLSGVVISIGLLFLWVRLVWFGVLGFWILIVPMLFFPGLGSGAYLYVPLLAFSVAIAAVAHHKPWWAVLFLTIWIPASYEELRLNRSPILAFGYEHRPYVEQVLASFASHPAPTAVVYEGTPPDFNVWGQEGLFAYALDKYDLPVYSVQQPEALEMIHRPGSVLLTWNVKEHRLLTDSFPGEGHEFSYVDFDQANPFWQLKEGWYPLAGNCRWAATRAVITLREPPGELSFSLLVDLMPRQAEQLHQVVSVSSQGQTIGEYRFETSGRRTVSWPVHSVGDTVKDIEIRFNPQYRLSWDSKNLGAMICACGFIPRAEAN